MPAMTDAEIWKFLSEGTRTAHIATVRRDGQPHVKPVWFVLDGEPGAPELVFTTAADTVKGARCGGTAGSRCPWTIRHPRTRSLS
jgi:nitroimidazol reductase NimA-like FMN-containing flavoprotein (pyridoxamine 5'-phosphate oxidase superfamily)